MQEPENGKKRERLSSGHDMASRPQIHNRGYLHKTGPITIPAWMGWGSAQLLAAGEGNHILGMSIYKHLCHVNSPLPHIVLYTFSLNVQFSFPSYIKGRKLCLLSEGHAFLVYPVDNILGVHKLCPKSFWQICNILLYLSTTLIYIYLNVSRLLIYKELLSHYSIYLCIPSQSTVQKRSLVMLVKTILLERQLQ